MTKNIIGHFPRHASGKHGLILWLAVPLILAGLLWPALVNRFPLVFSDTGGYLARPFEGTLMMGRSALYGAALSFGIPLDFWPNIIAQAVMIAWIIVLMLRVHGLGGRPIFATLIVLLLCAITALPWYVSQLMPDIFAPAAVIALHLLAFRKAALHGWEQSALVAIIVMAIANHMSILALTAGLVIFLAFLRAADMRTLCPRPNILWPAVALTAGVLLAPLSNFAIAGQFVFTPGGVNFLFSRLVQDGIAQKYLADRCPDPTIKLCAYREEINNYSADDWLWDAPSPLFRLGGADAFEPEARRIVGESLLAYPASQIKAATVSALRQFIAVRTGDGITDWNPHVEWILGRFAPHALASYRASPQARSGFDFSALNAAHVPVALIAVALLPVTLVLRRRLRIRPGAAACVTIVLVALCGNAAICGIFSNPHDRYQSRLVWLAPLAMIIAWSARGSQIREVGHRNLPSAPGGISGT